LSTIAIIQARMGSQRLPGKVMLPVGGKPMLAQVVERVRRSLHVDQTVVAVSNLPEDEPIWQWCTENHVPFVKGDANDVLSRYEMAARMFGGNLIVRVTSDCPMIDPQVIDASIKVLAENEHLDYACNFYPVRTFPQGLDTEVFTRACLDRLVLEADQPEDREHVTLKVYRNSHRFKIGSHMAGTSYADLRWTVDTEKDIRLIRDIFHCFPDNTFHWRDVIRAYLQHPEWRTVNHNVPQKVA
jgi:spore coat polysaccharide biosynthesis protein SpsF